MSTVIHMRSVPGKPLHRGLDEPLKCLMPDGTYDWIPTTFTWDGSSVPFIFQGFFPRHRHPIASCKHDWRCKHAKNAIERKFADGQFKKDVSTTSWKLTASIAYIGVRIGAVLGVGVNY